MYKMNNNKPIEIKTKNLLKSDSDVDFVMIKQLKMLLVLTHKHECTSLFLYSDTLMMTCIRHYMPDQVQNHLHASENNGTSTPIKIVAKKNCVSQSVPPREKIWVNVNDLQAVIKANKQMSSSNCSSQNDTENMVIQNISKSTQEDTPDVIVCNGKEKVFYLRKELQDSKTDSTTEVKQYTMTYETIRKAIIEQAKHDTSTIDKYLNATIRNSFGEFRNIRQSYYEQEINKVMKVWISWQGLYPGIRSTPLLYICYICNKGWWKLQPFKEHLKIHTNPYVKLKTEQFIDEMCICAGENHMHRQRIVDVRSPCWRCGKSASHHKIIDPNVEYSCEGCLIQKTTCMETTKHENRCLSFIQLKYGKAVTADNNIPCYICGIYYTEQKLYNKHMVSYHLVRSDEPIAIESNVCSLCEGRYIIHKYHDCPEKYKGLKCTSCNAKFTVLALRNLHAQLYKKKIKCSECGKGMVACMIPVHMLKHSKNYTAVRVCWGCDKKIMFTKYKYNNAHMKHHVSYLAKKRCSLRMLLPKSCVDGRIVKSETTLTIPNKDLDKFMSGLEDIEKSEANNPSKRSRDPDNLTKGLKKLKKSKPNNNLGPITQENANNYPDIRTMQEQLDAEITRDMEMEAAISEVFKTSKSYYKLIEKEKMEEKARESIETSVKVDLTDTDDELSEKGLFIDDRAYDHVSSKDSDSEAVKGNTQGELGSDDYEDSMSDADEEHGDSDFDDDLEWIVRSVAKERDMRIGADKNEPGFSRKDINKTDEIEGQLQKDISEEVVPKKEVQKNGIINGTKESDQYESKGCNSKDASVAKERSLLMDAVKIKPGSLRKDISKTNEIEGQLQNDISEEVVPKKEVQKNGKINGTKESDQYESKGCNSKGASVAKERNLLMDAVKIEPGSLHKDISKSNGIKGRLQNDISEEVAPKKKVQSNGDINGTKESNSFYEFKRCNFKGARVAKGALKNEPGSSHKDVEEPNQIAKHTHNDISEEVGHKKEIQSNGEINGTKESDIFYECKRCNFKGDWNQYLTHGITRCAEAIYRCNTCDSLFPKMSEYLDHLCTHGYDKFTCFICKQRFRLTFTFQRHITSHIRNTFSENYIEKISECSGTYFIFTCNECGARVQLNRFFEHWQKHFLSNGKVASEMYMEIDKELESTEIKRDGEKSNSDDDCIVIAESDDNIKEDLEAEKDKNLRRKTDLYECNNPSFKVSKMQRLCGVGRILRPRATPFGNRPRQ